MMNHQSRRYHHHNHHHHHNYFDRFRLGQKPQTFYGAIIFAVIGLLSLIWFVIRTGKKPARITYPCQQIAATNSVLFLAWITSLIAGPMIFSRISHYPHAKFVKSGLIIFTLSIAGYTLYRLNPSFNFTALSANPVCPQNNCSSWPSPRIVAVTNSGAVNTSSPASDYYSASNVSQSVVNSMMDQGIITLTGKSSIRESWTELFNKKFGHDWQSGQNIGIKLNWNNTHASYRDIKRFNPLPQTAVALLKHLVNEKGIPESNIYFYDCSSTVAFMPYFTDYVYAQGFKSVHYVADTVQSSSSVVKETPVVGSQVSFDNDTYWCQQVQSKFTYLINMPLLRAHGSEFGVTLGFKNHFGSLINPSSLNHYAAPETLLVPLNANTAIANKTVLTVGDGLYGGKYNNTDSPSVVYETLFFGQDPVAMDSVMTDHLSTFIATQPQAKHLKYLEVAANQGMGVFERWDNSTSRRYTKIDYQACKPTCTSTPSTPKPTSPPTNPPNPSPTPTFKPGDADGDGRVDGVDYSIWHNNYTKLTSLGVKAADFNLDGRVDGVDYSIWHNNY